MKSRHSPTPAAATVDMMKIVYATMTKHCSPNCPASNKARTADTIQRTTPAVTERGHTVQSGTLLMGREHERWYIIFE